jgi:hypothetical protein
MTLDRAVGWTGIPEQVKAESLYEGSHPRPRPLRWMPLFLIACSVALFCVSVVWPSVLEISLGVVIAGLPFDSKTGALG